MDHVIASFLALLYGHPEVAAVLVFLLAVLTHVVIGALLHLFRYRDFDWHRFGAFVEQDFATTRGVAILVTFITALATTSVPGGDWHAAFGPAFLALSASCAAATLPVLRDTLYELVELVSGQRPMVTRPSLRSPVAASSRR